MARMSSFPKPEVQSCPQTGTDLEQTWSRGELEVQDQSRAGSVEPISVVCQISEQDSSVKISLEVHNAPDDDSGKVFGHASASISCQINICCYKNCP